MTNHYHIVVETLEADLARGMRKLNGVYTMKAIAAEFGVHYTTVSRAVKEYESKESR